MSPKLILVASLLRARLVHLGRKVGWVGHCLRQLDHVAVQRVRRTHQWVAFNNRIWPGGRLGSLLLKLVTKLIEMGRIHTGRMLFSASAFVGLSPFQVQAQCGEPSVMNTGFTIPDDLMIRHMNDIEYIDHLKSNTLTCQSCAKRHIIDGEVDGIEYCNCEKKVNSVYGSPTQDVAWTPFLERKDILVWRQEHPEQKGLYAYKMYGRFDDVTAYEFLEVQMDVSAFRLSWDKSTAQCYVIEEAKGKPDANVTQIYYWEVNWPRFFSNRDYVCGRRAQIYDDEKLIVIYSKSTDHDSCPRKYKNHRVDDYWSVLTIRPFEEFNKLGIEFSLTAFENPGLSLPASVTTWVAIRAMPDFMLNLRKACIEMRKWKTNLVADKDKQRLANSKEPSYMETPQYQVGSNVTSAYA